MMRIYNDWLKGFCSHYPDRHIGLACLPYGDIDAAVQETIAWPSRPARAGAILLVGHGADVASHVGAAVEGGERRAAAVALSYLPDLAAQTIEKHGAASDVRCSSPSSRASDELVNIWPPSSAPNVLERYPNIRIAFGESGCAGSPMRSTAWISNGGPLHRPRPQDEAQRILASPVQGTFQFDRIGAKLIDDMGAESLIVGSDYPHGDGVWPHSTSTSRRQILPRCRRK